jgi:predicted RNA-binding protein YlqC (UPF0109 family)
MKEFIEYLIKQIVNYPDDVKVEEIESNGFFTYNINVNQEDMGIIIGKKGRNINSLRNIAKSKAIKDGVKIDLHLQETND